MDERIAEAFLNCNHWIWKVIVPGLLLFILAACLGGLING